MVTAVEEHFFIVAVSMLCFELAALPGDTFIQEEFKVWAATLYLLYR